MRSSIARAAPPCSAEWWKTLARKTPNADFPEPYGPVKLQARLRVLVVPSPTRARVARTRGVMT